jgi:hypothetical protein
MLEFVQALHGMLPPTVGIQIDSGLIMAVLVALVILRWR